MAASRAASSRSAMTSFIPAPANARAMPRPIPLAPPVTTATFPSRFFMMPLRRDDILVPTITARTATRQRTSYGAPLKLGARLAAQAGLSHTKLHVRPGLVHPRGRGRVPIDRSRLEGARRGSAARALHGRAVCARPAGLARNDARADRGSDPKARQARHVAGRSV